MERRYAERVLDSIPQAHIEAARAFLDALPDDFEAVGAEPLGERDERGYLIAYDGLIGVTAVKDGLYTLFALDGRQLHGLLPLADRFARQATGAIRAKQRELRHERGEPCPAGACGRCDRERLGVTV